MHMKRSESDLAHNFISQAGWCNCSDLHVIYVLYYVYFYMLKLAAIFVIMY